MIGVSAPIQPCDIEEAGGSDLDPDKLRRAVDFHLAHETTWPPSMFLPDGRYVGAASIGDRPEHAAVIGPIRARGGPNGMLLRDGRLIAEWGDTRRADMSFSVSKSYLAVLAGLAHADGLVPNLDEPVGASVPEPWFETSHNAAVTWRHLLQLTSEWSGTLWGKPDSADHGRVVGIDQPTQGKGESRALAAPGLHFEYNDIRVNLLAACLTHRFGRSLPDVLRERVMDPIGASADWEWHGYDGASIEVDGRALRCVSGGGHWGGGLFIGSRDHALLGSLILADGLWEGRQILPPGWVRAMGTPSPRNPQYGLLWWLNGGAAPRFPSAPADSLFALGAGTSLIWIAPSHHLVAVLRWIDGAHADALLGKITAALVH